MESPAWPGAAEEANLIRGGQERFLLAFLSS